MLGSLDAGGKSNSDSIINLVRSGKNDEVRLFLNEMPEYIRLKDQLQGASLLHLAVEENQSEIVRTLIDLQINVSIRDDDGKLFTIQMIMTNLGSILFIVK